MSRGEILGVGEVLWDLLPSGPRLGGAPGNFVFHCMQLGHASVVVSRIGIDHWGQRLRAELRRLHAPDALVQVDNDHATGTVAINLDETGQPTYTITENVAWDFIEPDAANMEAARQARIICFGSLAQRQPRSAATIQLLLRSPQLAPGSRIHIFDVNLRQQFYSADLLSTALQLADWIKVNEEELAVLANLWDLPTATPAQTLAALRQQFHLTLACVTRGERGCLVQSKHEEIDLPGVPVRVVDTVGAGDAFTAGLACLWLEGRSLRSAAEFANRYAAQVAAAAGATPHIDRRLCEYE